MTTQDDTLKPCPVEAMVEALARHLTRADCDPFIMSEISIGLYADKRWHEKATGAREMLTASGVTALAQEVERLIELSVEFRASMPADVLKSWATDVVNEITRIRIATSGIGGVTDGE